MPAQRNSPAPFLDAHKNVCCVEDQVLKAGAGLIAMAQAVEHHEIACCGTLPSGARQRDPRATIPLLAANLQQKIETDQKQTALGDAPPNAESLKKAS